MQQNLKPNLKICIPYKNVFLKCKMWKWLKRVPGYGTRERLPSVFEVRVIRAAVFLAVELCIYEGAARGRVERVGSIVDPFSTRQIAFTSKFSGTEICSITEGNEIFSSC